ncbi:MAG: SRPBCC family protein, partial [Pseudomonadota bacterium]|nr:SRPBCC family protein [Pseudomonadota bacterium]
MAIHREHRRLPYSCKQIFDLVADIERYPEFLPWCLDARVFERKKTNFLAELHVGRGPIRERFTSRVHL